LLKVVLNKHFHTLIREQLKLAVVRTPIERADSLFHFSFFY